MESSYDVRIWKTQVRTGTRTTTHTVRWSVAGVPRKRPFRTAALADAFRSELVTAARRGEAFDVESGEPASALRAQRQVTVLGFAEEYAAMKWPHLAPNSRRNTARALTNITLAVVVSDRGRPPDAILRKTLTAWSFNRRPGLTDRPQEIAKAHAWLERSIRTVDELAQPAVARGVLDALSRNADGSVSAPATVQRQRGVLVNLAEYAVERRLLTRNPITSLNWRAPRTVTAVDRRAVVNPVQARALLAAVRAQEPSGAGLAAFFAALYFAALRPGEAATLRRSNLAMPSEGWGDLLLEASTPEAGASWTDNGRRREERQLKHRARGETRHVPSPPELTAALREHLDRFGTDDRGLLFRGVRGGELAESTYCRVWRKARETALTADDAASPLARRPYDLRHAAVSTWLNAGVPSTQVAEWAGHSVDVLLRVYTNCVEGDDEVALRRIEAALR